MRSTYAHTCNINVYLSDLTKNMFYHTNKYVSQRNMFWLWISPVINGVAPHVL